MSNSKVRHSVQGPSPAGAQSVCVGKHVARDTESSLGSAPVMAKLDSGSRFRICAAKARLGRNDGQK